MTRTNPKPAHCDKCNSDNVAWFKSKRTGKFYLCEVFIDAEGDRVSSSRDFHSKYCGVIGAHDAEQRRISGGGDHEPKRGEDFTELAQQFALDISNVSIMQAVLSIADLARSNTKLAGLVSEIWKQQGENVLADVMDGALGRTPYDG